MNNINMQVRNLDRVIGIHAEFTLIDQVLGRALHYPRYVDDQENFPGATEEDGVCTGENTPASLAMQAAKRIDRLEKFIMSTIGSVESDPEILGNFLRGV